MRVKTMGVRTAFAAALLLLVPAACGNDATGLIDALDITNQTDRYAFDLDNPGTYSGTTRDQWTFTGTVARLVIENAATGGSGTITVQDADNGQVLVRTALEAGTFESQTGRAGTWIVTTILVNVTGKLKYEITKQ